MADEKEAENIVKKYASSYLTAFLISFKSL